MLKQNDITYIDPEDFDKVVFSKNCIVPVSTSVSSLDGIYASKIPANTPQTEKKTIQFKLNIDLSGLSLSQCLTLESKQHSLFTRGPVIAFQSYTKAGHIRIAEAMTMNVVDFIGRRSQLSAEDIRVRALTGLLYDILQDKGIGDPAFVYLKGKLEGLKIDVDSLLKEYALNANNETE